MKPLNTTIVLAAVVSLAALVPLRGNAQDAYSAYLLPSAAASAPCDNTDFLKDQQKFESGQLTQDVLENVCGTVTYVYPKKHTTSGWHGYFLLQLSAGNVIEIVSDLGQMNAPAWPWVQIGDSATVRGRYYYDNDSSQGIDWTHHGTSSSWTTPGYVVVNGTKYQ